MQAGWYQVTQWLLPGRALLVLFKGPDSSRKGPLPFFFLLLTAIKPKMLWLSNNYSEGLHLLSIFVCACIF